MGKNNKQIIKRTFINLFILHMDKKGSLSKIVFIENKFFKESVVIERIFYKKKYQHDC